MDCEEILRQKIALLDGEKTGAAASEIDAHLAACENCRREIERARQTIAIFERQARRAPAGVDLWTAIEKEIGAAPAAGFGLRWPPFALVGALLVAYKLIEMLPARDPGWALRFVPLALIVALFLFLKENPFKINTELIPEK